MQDLLDGIDDLAFLARTFEAIKDFADRGLILDWAVSGAIASYLYMSPTYTDDLDLMVAYPGTGLLIDPSPLFRYAEERGYLVTEGDHIQIHGVSVQFLPTGTPLTEEALVKAECSCIGGTSAKFLGAEYLMAIMLEVGRPKDFLRLLSMLDEAEYDHLKFHEDLVSRFDLRAKWNRLVERTGWKPRTP